MSVVFLIALGSTVPSSGTYFLTIVFIRVRYILDLVSILEYNAYSDITA